MSTPCTDEILSPYEAEILRLVAEGKNYRKIARRLNKQGGPVHRSYGTIKRVVRRIRKKMIVAQNTPNHMLYSLAKNWGMFV
ncbi:hypothetical protein A2841_01210 [Candidatus Kaiserbacteria bacterium RIFCSPHIGHO2_01_FULL_48_10]|uniref:HTH luxR-type domain-containing protein n=1 Tax=Candidatus Kaiserbacteria bacterium RIFCSPHIGHO2_01_FULL_48_10 TaxID=1798476 RepID=A0A1F6C4T4_9BACT|nr:MAG: hypothetical protein A2841_01210 [Candidatus Kaiserbacteria bacterium RIFCSPHIGHO2_01_FULL_48_10]